MSSPEPPSQYEELARALVGRGAAETTEFYRAGLITDVAVDAERFARQYRYLEENDLPMMVVYGRAGGILPVNLHAAIFPAEGVENDPRTVFTILRRATRGDRGRRREFRDLVDPGEARSGFIARMGRFLSVRLSGEGRRSAEPSAPGLDFEVHTDSPDLRVHYHPAYWRDEALVFGAPSTPVRGCLRPGRYCFGASGQFLPLTFEDAEYDVPSATSAKLYL
ncbi:hypothetical protein ACIRSS_26690 [Amycolatopsis sp. NPDC101161]|uniref:hypothetical protein n=1 Tax=Amycolatopsis sp. NPDC101161 TaxID=3363940 RepID=UPI003825CAEB